MNSSKRYTWLEVLLWVVLIAGSRVLFSGCDLSSSPNPKHSYETVTCLDTNAGNAQSNTCRTYIHYDNFSLVDQILLGVFQNIAPKAPAPPCPPILFAQAPSQVT